MTVLARKLGAIAFGVLLMARSAAAQDAAPPAPAAGGAALTLDQALKLAVKNNERAQKTPLRVETAEGGLDKARTAFLPTLVAQGAGVWNNPAVDKQGRRITENGSITLNQPLLNLSAFPLYGQAKHTLESERWGATEDLRLLLFDTTNAYLTVLSAEQVLTAAKQRLDRAKSDEADSGARSGAQLSSVNDVTRAHVETTTAAGQVASAQGNVDKAYLALAYLIGQPVTGGLITPDRTTTNAKNNNWKMEDVVRNAQERRPDVKSAVEHTASLWDFAEEPLYRLAPTLNLQGQIRAVDPSNGQTQPTETVQLALTWTIYDAGVRYADRRTRVAQAQSGELDEKALKRQVATDISQAIAALKAAREVYEISDDAVATAAKNTDETSILYKQGLAKAIEVTDANASRFDAEVTRATAKLQMEQAYLNLRYALGLGPVEDALPSPESVKGGDK